MLSHAPFFSAFLSRDYHAVAELLTCTVPPRKFGQETRKGAGCSGRREATLVGGGTRGEDTRERGSQLVGESAMALKRINKVSRSRKKAWVAEATAASVPTKHALAVISRPSRC